MTSGWHAGHSAVQGVDREVVEQRIDQLDHVRRLRADGVDGGRGSEGC
jgi:hypothetical protein